MTTPTILILIGIINLFLILLIKNIKLKKEIKKLKQPKNIDYQTYFSIIKLYSEHNDYIFNVHQLRNEFDWSWDTIHSVIGQLIILGHIDKVTSIECESCNTYTSVKCNHELDNLTHCMNCQSLLNKTDDFTYTGFKINDKGLNNR